MPTLFGGMEFYMSETNYVLSCCSTADMPKEYFDKRNIPYCCFHFIMDGKEYPDDLGQTMSFEDFYSRVGSGAMPTTSQVNVGQFIEFFEPILKEGHDILHLSFSSGLSGVYNSACIARNQLIEKYPERTFEVVDTLCASSGFGLLVDMAADLRDSGKSLTEVRDWVEANKLKIHHWFFSTDLTHYKRGGRISAASCIAGTVLNICPLLNMDKNGKLMPVEKVRGKKNVIEKIVARMIENAEDGINYSRKCFISNSDAYEDAKKVAELVNQNFSNLSEPLRINSIGTVIGSHTGRGTVALFFYGKERI